MDMRRQYFSGHTGWTEKTWEDFVALDELMAAVREELFAAQERMAQKQAFMYLFMNQEQPESGLGLWYMQSNGVKVWSLEGVAEERTRKGEMVPVLEWRGVDYNNLRADLPTLEWEDSSSSWI
ncbi:hypothetical protein GGS21DRAFT_508246 [Xylaria nigripes]|nr:hypothetical protein GGS21DRAFT_508246 [Xylaria nigripes]